MKKWLQTPRRRGILCGIVTTAIQFLLIPCFLMRGVPDFIWITLMILLPVIAGGFLLHNWPRSALRWSLLFECIIVLILSKPLGNMLGFHLESFSYDLFNYIAYWLFALGWTFGAAAAQWLVLFLMELEAK